MSTIGDVVFYISIYCSKIRGEMFNLAEALKKTKSVFLEIYPIGEKMSPKCLLM